MTKFTVAVVDDHPMLLEGLKAIFQDNEAYRVLSTGNCADDAIRIATSTEPDVLILDLNLPGDAFEAIARIVSSASVTRIVAFTASANIQHAVLALNKGASGYVLKGSTDKELFGALDTVLAGDSYITPGFAGKVISALSTGQEKTRLSAREDQVVKLLLGGRTNREIGQELRLSEKTVKQYMSQLMQKLEVRNRVEVVLAAQQLQIAATSLEPRDAL
ncbi:response regulator transcription factor [Sedimentitalea sp.]|uniref:response regulator transcription factor n=1 Tax=Sedimentitalea sp. TaxID=2048915 RepID=UPI0032991D20